MIFEETESPLDYPGGTRTRLQVRDANAGAPGARDVYFAETHRTVKRGARGQPLKRPRKVVVPGAGEDVVGFIDFRTPRNTVEIDYIAVREDQRGRGIARLLVDELYSRYHDVDWINFGDIVEPQILKLYQEKRDQAAVEQVPMTYGKDRWTMNNPRQLPLLDRMLETPGAGQLDPALTVRSPADGLRALEHPAVMKQWKRSLKWEPKNKKAVLIPCSSEKPYYTSASHKHGYLPAIKDKALDTFVVSEPMAVIPYAWVDEYPNMAYEFAPKHVKGKTRQLLVERIRGWLEKVGPKYETIYLALPDHHRKMVMDALGEIELPLVNLSITVCRAEGGCGPKTFRATGKDYRKWLGRKLRPNPEGTELKRKLMR